MVDKKHCFSIQKNVNRFYWKSSWSVIWSCM